jgi:hypothetical protein
LHGLGARELIVFGLGPMGCIPLQMVLSTTGDCQDRANKLALSFNKASSKLLDDLSAKLPNASFQFGDAYDVVNNVINNPYKYGALIYFTHMITSAAFPLMFTPCELLVYVFSKRICVNQVDLFTPTNISFKYINRKNVRVKPKGGS